MIFKVGNVPPDIGDGCERRWEGNPGSVVDCPRWVVERRTSGCGKHVSSFGDVVHLDGGFQRDRGKVCRRASHSWRMKIRAEMNSIALLCVRELSLETYLC